MTRRHRDIVVIGTSAGGLDALDSLVGQLASDLPAALCVVQHLAAESSGDGLVYRLSRHGNFRCKLAEEGERFGPGGLYIAPPDHHLLVKRHTLRVTRGARENRYRPAIDPLFRSAAVTHGVRVIGVLLTGMLDDGTAGLAAIQRCGGVTVVQDPEDAEYPDMPENAASNVDVAHCLPLAEMGRLLEKLVHESPGRPRAIPRDLAVESKIAERVLTGIHPAGDLGERTPYSCPSCGGPLWEIRDAGPPRYRCHTGHVFTPAALLAGESRKIEESLWVTLRMLEERRHQLLQMSRHERGSWGRRHYSNQAKEAETNIKRIREMLLAPERGGA